MNNDFFNDSNNTDDEIDLFSDQDFTSDSKNSSVEEKANATLSFKQRLKKHKTLFEIIFYIVFAVLFINLVPKYVMERVSVDGNSMNNTLYNNDQLIGEKLSVRANRLKRYDIIYFYPRGNRNTEAFIKRIIGMPGDTVQIIDSVVYVNGLPLQEDYAAEAVFESENAAEPIRLGYDEYFVLGDNRNHSTDSRSSMVGVVKYADIEGRTIFRIWPLNRFGKIH